MIEKRDFRIKNGHCQLYGKITTNDINLAYCHLIGIDPNNIEGLNNNQN